MKPFKGQCNEVKRKGYKTAKGHQVKPILCEEQIWFEPSLQPGISVGHCRHGKKDNSELVYKKL